MSRIISARVRTSAIQVWDCTASLFALELMHPGEWLYISASSIDDTPLVSNRYGQFNAIDPDRQVHTLRLSFLINTLAQRGMRVRLLAPPHGISHDFINILSPLIEHRAAKSLYNWGVFSAHFCLRGSLNFSQDGVSLGEDQVELDVLESSIQAAQMDLDRYWEELG